MLIYALCLRKMNKKVFTVVAYKEENWELASALGDLFFTDYIIVSFNFVSVHIMTS